MSLIQIINSEHSDDFGQLITDIKANILSYLEARQKAQKERMIIIGKINLVILSHVLMEKLQSGYAGMPRHMI